MRASGSRALTELRVLPLTGIPEVGPGDDLAALVGDAVERAGGLEAGDVLVVAHKVLSKAAGRIARDEDHAALVLAEARSIRRPRGALGLPRTKLRIGC